MFLHKNLEQFPVSLCDQHTVTEITLFVKINLQDPFHQRSDLQISYLMLTSGNIWWEMMSSSDCRAINVHNCTSYKLLQLHSPSVI